MGFLDIQIEHEYARIEQRLKICQTGYLEMQLYRNKVQNKCQYIR